MDNNKINIKKLFSGLQKQMTAQLSTDREIIIHPGSKGDALENAWIDWLREYLPNRYSVEKAIVIDYDGFISDQIDVVIYDNWYTPFIFSQNGFHYIPAEGVYAIFEVKPDIKGTVGTDTYIEYAAKKIESVRNLNRTSTTMINSGTMVPARPLTKIVGGILCSSNTYTHNNNTTIIKEIKRLEGLKGLDLGCIADYGSFFVEYSGEEIIIENDLKKRYTDYYRNRTVEDVHFSSSQNSLVTFFMQLTRYLQQAIGTVPAIDLQAYLNKINERIDPEI